MRTNHFRGPACLSGTTLFTLCLLAAAPNTAEAYNVCIEGDEYACTHEIMVRSAFELYLDDTAGDWRQRALHAELNANWEHVQLGVGDPDRFDPLYGNGGLGGALTTISHFWSPDESIGEPMILGFLGEDPYANALQTARALFSRALGEYAAGNTEAAYRYLGMVAHYLGDQTIPTHVHQDTHGPDWIDYDGYEEWMSQGEMYCGDAARTDGTCSFTAAGICLDPESMACAADQHASSRAYLTFAERSQLRGEGILVGGRQQPSDELLWLFLNVNQVADYFASEGTPELRTITPLCESGALTEHPISGEPCGLYDGDGGYPVDPYVSGWVRASVDWVQTQCTVAEGGMCPLTGADLIDNHGMYDDVPMPVDAGGNYSRIRNYSYLNGVRGIAGLFALWVEATSQPILTVDIIEMAEKGAETLDTFDAADFFVALNISQPGYPGRYLEEPSGAWRYIGGGDLSGTRPMFCNMTRRDAFRRQYGSAVNCVSGPPRLVPVGDPLCPSSGVPLADSECLVGGCGTEQQSRVFNTTDREAGVYHFGEAFAYRRGLTRYVRGTDRADLNLQLWDNDESAEVFNDPYDSDDIVDINPSTADSRDLDYRIDLAACLAGSSPCDGRITSEGGGEGGVFTPDEDGRLIFDVRMVQPPRTLVIEPGEAIIIGVGETVVVGAGTTLVNNGVIINDGVIAVGAMGRIDNRGTIINQRVLRVETDGVIDNALGAAIDNAAGNNVQNSGTINNAGGIFDPYGHYYGTRPATNPVVDGYLLGPFVSGARTCSALGGSTWVASSNTCIATSGMWLRAGKILQIPVGATLVLRASLSNDGDIINDGTLDLTSGTVNNCGTLTGGGTVINPGAIGTTCVVSADAAQCASFGGMFDTTTSTCELGRFGLITRGVAVGETLTIPAGVTWDLYRGLTNYGTINIEETATLVLTGDSGVTGGIDNLLDDPSGTYGAINNYGTLSLEVNGVKGIPTTILNDGFITNYGTIDNDGNIVGDGFLTNQCGSTYNLLHAFVPPWDPTGADHEISDGVCPPPDRDGDGVPDADDLFPDDALESADADGDGVGDNGDAFPDDASETMDSDGDGVGDNADAFPDDASETIDTDGDGVGDNADAFATDPAESMDSDGDGVGNNADAFPYDPDDEIGIAVDGDDGWIIEQVAFLDPSDLPDLPTGVSLYYRVIEFALSKETPGGDAVVTITYPDAIAAEAAWWFYGSTAPDEERQWYAYPGATLDGNTVTFTLSDGGMGDSDHEVNGRIVEAGSPGTPDPEAPPIGPPDAETGGCGCATASAREQATNALLPLLALGAIALRRRRRGGTGSREWNKRLSQ